MISFYPLRIKKQYLILAIIWLIPSIGIYAQKELGTLAIEEYLTVATNRMDYLEVPIAWKMEGKIQADLNEGINNLMEEKPVLALENFSNVIRQDNRIWQAYYYRGICKKQLRKFAGAREDLDHVKAAGHALYEINLELGKIAFMQRDDLAANSYFKKATKISPERADAYFQIGNRDLETGASKRAISSFKKALEHNPSLHLARITMALLYWSLKDEQAALDQLNTVLKSDSLNGHALLLRSTINLVKHKDQSLADLNKLLKINPTNVTGLLSRGLIHTEAENFDRAFPDFQKLVESHKIDYNQFEGMQTAFDKLVDIQNTGSYVVSRIYGLPEKDATLIKKAYCLFLLTSYDKSISTINESELANSEPLCLFIKAVAHEHMGKHRDAFQYYDLALKLDNDILDAHKKCGIYEQELKQWEESVKDFTEVLRINPEYYMVYKTRGVSYFWLNNFKKSIADFNQFLARDTADLEVLGYRGISHLKDGQWLNGSIDLLVSGNAGLVNYKKLGSHVDSLLSISDTTTTLSYLNKITKLAPFFTEGYATKMKLFIGNNNWSDVAKQIDLAINNIRSDANGLDVSYLLTVKAMVLSRSNNYNDALTKLAEAIKADKNNSTAWLERGKVLLKAGKVSKALPVLRKASALGHKEADAIIATLN